MEAPGGEAEHVAAPASDASVPARTAPSVNAVNALIHLYRAEVGRMTAYRSRLDTTINWAITSSAIVATFAFGNPHVSHAAFIFVMFINYFFLQLESRRFQAYEASRYRVRLLERYFYPEVLGTPPDTGWTAQLIAALWNYYSPVTGLYTTMGWRLRSSYLWIYGAVLVAWLTKLDVPGHPSLYFWDRAAIGSIPGWLVCLLVAALHLWLVVLAVRAKGESRGGERRPPQLRQVPPD